jgi:2-iminobutanoate/2-iminopropanoate deaminase
VCYRQLDGIVRSLGGTLADVVKLTSFLTDMSELGSLADVRSRYFSAPYPASTAVEVSRLAREGLLIEIEAVAAISSNES